jgi:hypothetical protein
VQQVIRGRPRQSQVNAGRGVMWMRNWWSIEGRSEERGARSEEKESEARSQKGPQ